MGEKVGIYQITTQMYVKLGTTQVTLQRRGGMAERRCYQMLGWSDKGEAFGLRSEGRWGGCRLRDEGKTSVTDHVVHSSQGNVVQEGHLGRLDLLITTNSPAVQQKLAQSKTWVILDSFFFFSHTLYYIRIHQKYCWLLYKNISRFNTIPIKSPAGYFVGIDKLNLKYIWRGKRPRIASWRRETQSEDWHNPQTVKHIMQSRWCNIGQKGDK